MERRAKVDLFEEIRREYEFGVGSVGAVARKLSVHRRLVRQALADARPPDRKRTQRRRPVIECLFRSLKAFWRVIARRRASSATLRIASGSASKLRCRS